MGKKKAQKREEAPDIWCFYCDRTFEDEAVLMQHQKNKHFKCHLCSRKLQTASGMVIHIEQVHKETITKVPAAKEGRDSIEFDVFGMQGIPAEFIAERAAKKMRGEDPSLGSFGAAAGPGVMAPGMPGMMPGMPYPGMYPPGAPVYPPGAFPGAPPPGYGYPGAPPMGYPGAPPHMMGPGPGMMPPPHMMGMYPPRPGLPPPAPYAPPAPLPPLQPPPPSGPSPAANGSPRPLFPVAGATASSGANGTKAPAAAAAAAAGPGELQMVYDDEAECMEEKRAKLDKYRYEEAGYAATASA